MSVFGQRWREKYEAQRTGYANILTWDLWNGWADDLELEQRAARELWNGLIVFWGGDESTARLYLERAHAVCERAALEKTYCFPAEPQERPALQVDYPRNWGTMSRVRAHVRGLLGRARAHELAVADFRDAAADYAESCTEYSASTWDQVGQSYTLDAVRLSLLADDMTAAAMLLKTPHHFNCPSGAIGYP